MNKAKWFVVRKPSTCEIVAKSTNQIVQKYFIFTGSPLPLGELKGSLGMRQ